MQGEAQVCGFSHWLESGSVHLLKITGGISLGERHVPFGIHGILGV